MEDHAMRNKCAALAKSIIEKAKRNLEETGEFSITVFDIVNADPEFAPSSAYFILMLLRQNFEKENYLVKQSKGLLTIKKCKKEKEKE